MQVKMPIHAQLKTAPSWRDVILSGLAGGVVNWFCNSQFVGIVVFALLMLLIVPRTRSSDG